MDELGPSPNPQGAPSEVKTQPAPPTAETDPSGDDRTQSQRGKSENESPPEFGALAKTAAALWPIVVIALVWVYNLAVSARLRNLIILGLIVAAIVGLAIGFMWARRYQTAVARMTAFVVLLVAATVAAILPVILLGTEERILFLKLGAILVLSLLPGLLYLQFIAVKAEGLRDEYIHNLHRLRIDTYENLPKPPVGSLFYRGDNAVQRDEDNLYLKKFDALFGGPILRPDGTIIRRRGGNLLPLGLCTILLAIGWALVLQPEPISGARLFDEFTLSGRPILPGDALRFGFAGAYMFILEMLIRRYFQDDLKTSAYINAAGRIVSTILLVTAVHQVWPASSGTGQENAIAFLIGVFPTLGLKAIQSLVALPLRRLLPSLQTDYPLSDLDGLNIWYESRLLEEGIEDMQNLSTANLVDVMLRTRVPVERLVDWVDQAHLFLRVSKVRPKDENGGELPSDREILRRLGIRTATDLEDAFRVKFRPSISDSRDEDPPGFRNTLRRALNRGGESLPSITWSILKTFSREPNLYHVRQWKSLAWDLERQQRQAALAQLRAAREPVTIPDVPMVTEPSAIVAGSEGAVAKVVPSPKGAPAGTRDGG